MAPEGAQPTPVMRRIVFALLFPLFLAACDGGGPEYSNQATTGDDAYARGGQERISICHRTLSQTNPWVRITIAAPAVRHHLANHLNREGNPADYLANDPNSPLDENCNPRVVTAQGRIVIELISQAAYLNQSELWLFAPGSNPGPTQQPLDGTNQRYIFRNDFAYGVPSNAPDANGATSHTGPVYTIPATDLPIDTPLHFGLFVNNLYNAGFTNPQDNRTRGAWFYTGLAGMNFDNAVHALFTPVALPPGASEAYELGFEDLCQVTPGMPAVCANTLDFTDFDYNDIVYTVTIYPN